jgi:serine/arginine repetitive matrix protein 1
MTKVNMDVVKPWITKRLTELLGIEDDVIIDFCFNLLETNQFPDGREMQMNLMGFLYGKKARVFMQELWAHLLSAQESVGGIPTAFIEERKEEIRKMQVEKTRIEESLKKHGNTSEPVVEDRTQSKGEKTRTKSETPLSDSDTKVKLV